MKLETIKVQTRENLGKNSSRKLQLTDEIPLVLYGGGQEPVNLKINKGDMVSMLGHHSGETAIVQIDVEDKPDFNSPAMLKEVQHHPVKDMILHADFVRIRLDQTITCPVPLVLTGNPVGVLNGGVLDHQCRELEVECLAMDVPNEITLDVSQLEMEESLHVSDVVAPEGVTILTDPDRAVAAIHPPRLLVEETEGEEPEAGAEPAIAGEEEEGEEESEES